VHPLLVDAAVARKTGIALIVEAGRRVDEHAALDAPQESVVVNVISLIIFCGR
jgi:hypothetical protein